MTTIRYAKFNQKWQFYANVKLAIKDEKHNQNVFTILNVFSLSLMHGLLQLQYQIV